MGDIVDIQLKDLAKLLDSRKISLGLSEEAREWLAERGYDSRFGARPLRRVIQNELQNKLAEKILQGSIVDGAKIKVSVKNDELIFA